MPDLRPSLGVGAERKQFADLLEREPELLGPLDESDVGPVLVVEPAVAGRTARHRGQELALFVVANGVNINVCSLRNVSGRECGHGAIGAAVVRRGRMGPYALEYGLGFPEGARISPIFTPVHQPGRQTERGCPRAIAC